MEITKNKVKIYKYAKGLYLIKGISPKRGLYTINDIIELVRERFGYTISRKTLIAWKKWNKWDRNNED